MAWRVRALHNGYLFTIITRSVMHWVIAPSPPVFPSSYPPLFDRGLLKTTLLTVGSDPDVCLKVTRKEGLALRCLGEQLQASGGRSVALEDLLHAGSFTPVQPLRDSQVPRE